jgi:lactoylglutathione lyase
MKSSMLEPVRHTRGAERMGLTHLAVSVGSAHGVDALTNRLRQDGFEVVNGPRHTGDGYYESVILDPDGNRIEITI